jgi:hypothetical protein
MFLAYLVPSLALAQDQPPPPPPPPAEAAPEAAPAPAVDAPAAETAPAQTAAPTVEDRLTDLEGKMEGLQESTAATDATVSSLKKLKFSGYVQGRYEWHDDAGAGVSNDTARAPRGTNRFLVRRARLKATYQGRLSEYVLQIDAVPEGVALRDAEASLFLDENVIPSATPFELRFTVGQFKVPFGFELLQSSSDREMPERSAMIRTLFPGERDRGARIQAKYGIFRLAAALINGSAFPALTGGPTVSIGTFDQSSFKDVVGRLGADLEFLVVGASAYYGHTINIANLGAPTAMNANVGYLRYERVRLGADAQLYFDVPAVGGLVLRGEVIWASDSNLDYAGVAKNECRDIESLGWYATVVQNVGDHLGAVVRVDQFDRNTGIASTCDPALRNPTLSDKVTTIGGGLLVHVSGNLKGTAVYEHAIEQGSAKRDNDVFTLQLQARF